MANPFDIVGNVMGAGINWFNASENREAQEEENARKWAFAQAQMEQQEAHFRQQVREAETNRLQQEKFAQQGIRWKVADATAAGLHPLAALGAQVISPSGFNVGSASPVSVNTEAPSTDLGSMGQDISRAISAMGTQEEKLSDYQTKLQALQLERGSLENTLLKAQILKASQPAARQPGLPLANPKLGIDGQPATASTTTGGFPVSADKIEQKADTIPKHARLRLLGLPLNTAPFASDAEDLETRYGDLAEKVFGLGNIPIDMAYSLTQRVPSVANWMEDQYRRIRPATFKERWKGR